jgi:D-alanine-D-alanine ligase
VQITVILGGASSERDVSLASGFRVVDALRSAGHQVSAVDPVSGVLRPSEELALRSSGMKTAPPSLAELAKLGGTRRRELSPEVVLLSEVREADVVFLGLHGGQGEDGTIQAMLGSVGVAYTGSGPLASALAMDKDLSKTLFRAAGVGTPEWLMAPASDDVVERILGYPVVVKPSKQGSTVGLSVVRERAALQEAIATAYQYDDEVMLERFIPGRELTVGVLGDDALPAGEIFPKHEIYDYECKYTTGMASEEFPARVTPLEAAALQDQALRAFRALKLRGYARIDFRMDPSGALYCLEANTLPGLTELSLMPQAAAARGLSFVQLCERIVAIATGGK